MADDETPDEDFEAESLDEDFSEELEDETDSDEETFDDLEVEADAVDPAAVVDDDAKAVDTPAPAGKATATKSRKSGDDDDDEEEDDDVDPDDVEADLDAILKDRIAAQPEDEDDEEDQAPEPDERGDGAGRIQPKKADEFVCQSCFLVKHRRQLADETLMMCVDCV